jgi:uncharacterized protein involved in high-affinity Fe2+ transport
MESLKIYNCFYKIWINLKQRNTISDVSLKFKIMKTNALLLIALLLVKTISYGQYTASANANVVSTENSIKDKNDFSKFPEESFAMDGKSKRDVPWFVERFKIAAGYYFVVNNTNVSVGNNNGMIGTDIDFENDLGLQKNSSSFFGNIQWRSTSRSRFDLSYYGLNRKSTYTIKKTFDFGDNTYNINTTINAFFNTDIYRFSYGYAILSKPKYELGLLIGAHIVRTGVGIGVNSTNVNLVYKDDFGFTAPLPDFGLWGGYAISDRFAMNAEFDYLQIEVNGIKGRILGYNFSADYRVLKQFDLSLGYTGLNFSVDAIRDNSNGHLRWGNNGPSLKAVYSFGNKKWN